jgi:hypothetical protein
MRHPVQGPFAFWRGAEPHHRDGDRDGDRGHAGSDEQGAHLSNFAAAAETGGSAAWQVGLIWVGTPRVSPP